MTAFNRTINEKILAKLPMLFRRIPSQKLELVEESVRIRKEKPQNDFFTFFQNPEASAASYIAGRSF